MRHKYATQGIVLSRSSTSEASSYITIVTPDLGVVRAKAQGVRKPGAKLASSLQTLAESDISLIKGREGWRLAGAILTRNWFQELDTGTRTKAGRVAQLLIRLVPGQLQEPSLFATYADFLQSLAGLDEEAQEAATFLAGLKLLKALGLDPEELPGAGDFSHETLEEIQNSRAEIIARINRGIAASGL